MKLNLNYNMTIYPNDEGWKEIERLITEYYKPINADMDFTQNMEYHKTKDGGYKNHMWFIMHILHSMFFNGSHLFKTAEITISNNWG